MGKLRGGGPVVLLVEDDAGLAAMLLDALAARHYRVWHAANAAEAEAILDQVQADLVIVDLMLPDRSGLILCNDLKVRSAAPIIICSATKRHDDAALGFRLGADDFIPKPFTVDELEARMQRAMRHEAAQIAPVSARAAVQKLGDLVIDRARCQITMGGRVIQLTPTEYRLLCELVNRPGEVLSQKELAESVWRFDDAAIRRSLEVHMRRLRAKLSAAGGPNLATRRGFGYQLGH
jgi:DNA-binding response OmpR family regulator